MTEPARDLIVLPPTSTEGLDEIFDVRELDASQDANRLSGGSSVREQGANSVRQDANLLSVEQAAERLGISVRAVQKRLKKGTLTGRKDKTNQGERWLIDLREQDASQTEERDRLIIELQAKIEALTWRNGYLEAQLETEREQVKLLTDSQHKPGWWARFKKWCAAQ